MEVERIVIAGGGTGGHLYPGIAIAQELQRRRGGVEIVIAGAGLPLERQIVEPHGYRLLAIPSGALVGKSLEEKAYVIGLAFRGYLESMQALVKLKPKVVIGVGGYASGPMVMAAITLRIPTLIHEQNATPGVTNRMLSAWVKRVALSFEETRHHFGGRGEVTGNPIRAEFQTARRKTRGEKFRILIFGGSQGAHAINDAVIAALPHLEEHRLGLGFQHGTGPGDLEKIRSAYAGGGFDATAEPFITKIREAYERADLVISRAGASTVSEIAACGKAAVLIPLPTAAHDHQRSNARRLAEVGAAVLLEQKALSGEALARIILSFLRDPGKVGTMERAAAAQARPDAAIRIADMVEELIA